MPFGQEADVFSLGVVYIVLLTGREPESSGASSSEDGAAFLPRRPQNSFGIDADALRAATPSDAPASFVELACQCVAYEPADRPTANDAQDWLQELYGELDHAQEQRDRAVSPAHFAAEGEGSAANGRGAGAGGNGAAVPSLLSGIVAEFDEARERPSGRPPADSGENAELAQIERRAQRQQNAAKRPPPRPPPTCRELCEATCEACTVS